MCHLWNRRVPSRSLTKFTIPVCPAILLSVRPDFAEASSRALYIVKVVAFIV